MSDSDSGGGDSHLKCGLTGLSLVQIRSGRIVALGMTLKSRKVVEVELLVDVEEKLVEVELVEVV